jgi:hypothetical protein
VGKNNVLNNGQTFMSSSLSTLDNDTWYIKFGASIHLSHRRDWFKRYTEIPPMHIYLGVDMMLKVVGMGDVEVTMIMGDKKLDSVFKNVLYIP